MLVVGIIIFLLLSAFFSASEIAYVSSNKLGIEVLKEKGTRRARLISSFYEKPKKFLGTTLVGNNIALVVFTALMTKFLSPLFGDLNPDSALVLIGNTLLITIVVLILGEFLPKTFSRVYSIGFLHIAAYPLRFFQWLLTFPTWSMTLLSGMIIKYIFKGPIDKADPNLSMVDLQHYLEEISEGDENIDKEILTNAMNLGQLKVRDCMIPRNEISYIDLNSTIPELIEEFKSSNHSRVIVADGDVENVVGYIHHQQLISNPKNLKKLVLMLPYVPEAMNILLLLNKFIANKTSMACVVDEFGGTAGLITLEDILEEIFGEIEDEHDTEEFEYTQLSENEFRFSGRVELDMINEKFENLNIPEGEYHTLSGYVVMTSGSIPDQNSEITIDGMRLIFEKVSDKRIEQIRLIKLPEPKSENA
jgi:CBS domain containing-hemolysin-like protein